MTAQAMQCPLQALTKTMLKDELSTRFDQYADAYDKHAVVQKLVAAHALEILGTKVEKNTEHKVLLDLGCGTSNYLNQFEPFAKTTIGLDMSHNMLRQSVAKLPEARQGLAYFLNADAENLPLANNSIDTVFSSMAMQWCMSPKQLMNEVHRVLTPTGGGTLAILIDNSFASLHGAYKTLGLQSRLNRFFSADQWLNCAHAHNWSVEHEIKAFITYHQSVIEMLRSIKKVGAGTKYNKVNPYKGVSKQTTTISRKELQALSHILKRKDAGTVKMNDRGEAQGLANAPVTVALNQDTKALGLEYVVLFLSIKKIINE